MYQHNHYASDVADATAKSINSGVDLNTGYPWFQNHGLQWALGNKTVTESTVGHWLLDESRLIPLVFELADYGRPALAAHPDDRFVLPSPARSRGWSDMGHTGRTMSVFEWGLHPSSRLSSGCTIPTQVSFPPPHFEWAFTHPKLSP